MFTIFWGRASLRLKDWSLKLPSCTADRILQSIVIDKTKFPNLILYQTSLTLQDIKGTLISVWHSGKLERQKTFWNAFFTLTHKVPSCFSEQKQYRCQLFHQARKSSFRGEKKEHVLSNELLTSFFHNALLDRILYNVMFYVHFWMLYYWYINITFFQRLHLSLLYMNIAFPSQNASGNKSKGFRTIFTSRHFPSINMFLLNVISPMPIG